MNRPRRRRWPWAVAVVMFCVGATGIALSVSPDGTGVESIWAAPPFLLLLGSCLGAGAILQSRRPDHPVSWLVWLPAFHMFLTSVARTLERLVDPDVASWAVWFAEASWAATFLPLAIYLPLLFPTGRPPSRGWNWVRWIGGASVVLVATGNAIAPDLLEDRMNPAAVAGPLPEVVLVPGGLLMVVSFAAAAASSVVRFRRSTGVERQQLRWFAHAAILVPVAWVIAGLFEGSAYAVVVPVVLSTVLSLLPVAVAVAVLRYRLYDIDHVVNRTVSWTLLTVVLAGLYVGIVLTAQAVLGRDVPDAVIALATLTAAAAFQPLRGRVQRLVDRRFNRARYDAAETVAAFGQLLRQEFAPDRVVRHLATTVQRTLEPAALTMWTPVGRDADAVDVGHK